MREGQIGVEGEPRRQPGIVRPLDTNAAARSSGFGRARVAHEEQFGVDAQVPQGDCGLHAAEAHGPEADLGAFGPDERRNAIGRRAADRIDGDGHTAGVVAVETRAGVDVDLGALQGPKIAATFGLTRPADPSPEFSG